MLTCYACMRRCLRTVIGDLPQIPSSPRSKLTSNAYGGISFTRNYSSSSTREKHKVGVRTASPDHGRRGGDNSGSNARQKWIESRGIRPASKKKTLFSTDKELSQQLRYLKDPLKLADYVRKTLQRDDFETAQKVVRAASSDIQCVVSWNHLVDWQLSKGSMNAAIKTYNEMKKRAQFPDAHTYTIIFRGCAMHGQAASALAKVLVIYHSMQSEKSSIKPTAIHTNAVLKMCARAKDIDAMLAVAAGMPTKGVGSPNNLTYTTIFNALRIFAVSDLRGTLTSMQKRANCQKVTMDARRMWIDVVARWREGGIWLDEELVCAMGRLLLVGTRRDVDDILSLVEQTMNIPRQVARLGTEERRQIDPLAPKPHNSSQEPEKEASSPEHPSKMNEENLSPKQDINDEQPETTVIDYFHHVTPPAREGSSGIYAQPGQNSLSLVLQALFEMKLKEPAQKYWHIFTTKCNVKPDQENFHSYLRILRVARASNETVNLLLRMPMQDMKHSTFRIAMATCRRDKLNRSAFANGGKLLDLMQTALREPDIAFLEDYLELAITAPAYSKKVSSSGKNDASKFEQGKQILRALERLNPSFVNLKAILHFQDPELAKKSPTERTYFVDSILSLTKKMISAFDLLMSHAMVPGEFYRPLIEQRSKLIAFVTRHKYLKSSSTSKRRMSDTEVDDVVKWSADALSTLASPETILKPTPSDKEPSDQPLSDYELPTRFLNHANDPEWQRRLSETRRSPETYEAIPNKMRENITFSDWQDEQQLPNKDMRDLTFEERRAAEQAAKEIFGPA